MTENTEFKRDIYPYKMENDTICLGENLLYKFEINEEGDIEL